MVFETPVRLAISLMVMDLRSIPRPPLGVSSVKTDSAAVLARRVRLFAAALPGFRKGNEIGFVNYSNR